MDLLAEVVEDNDRVSLLQESVGGMRSNEAGSPEYKNLLHNVRQDTAEMRGNGK
jgi:hypothetical protein